MTAVTSTTPSLSDLGDVSVFEPPKRLGRFVVDRLLARGGMGAVYLAHAEGPAGFYKQVALKCILDERGPHRSQELFVNEARLAALLSHPNIVQTFELGEEAGLFYLAMEYVEGLNLRVLLRELKRRKHRISIPVAIHLCAQALHGLHYAHNFKDASGQSRPILHRDVSPENVLLSSGGVVKVADFGIALMTLPGNITGGMTHGKAAYMAPERYDGGMPVDSRCDVFSTGVVLYELLTGGLPFPGPSALSIADRVLSEHVENVCTKRPEVPEGLGQIVHRAIRRHPEDRFGSALEFAAALESFASHNGLMATQIEVAALAQTLVATATPPASKFRQTPLLVAPDEVATVQSVNAAYLVDSELIISEPSQVPNPKRRSLKRGGLALVAFALIVGCTVGAAALRARSSSRSAPSVTRTEDSIPQPEQGEPPLAVAASSGAPAAEAQSEANEVSIDLAPTDLSVKEPTRTPPTSKGEPLNPRRPTEATPLRSSKAIASKALATHWVELRVHPWAEAWLDGKRMGVTPLPPFKLSSGRHTLKLVNAELKVDWTVPLNVSSKAQQRVSVNLFTLKVTNETKPRAESAPEQD